MKIGILTHPQHINYGGILQCYAFSSFLRGKGNEVYVIRRANDVMWLKRIVLAILIKLHIPYHYNKRQIDKGLNIRPFSDTYINRTSPIYSQDAMRKVCKKYGLDAVVVGSDQVWRKSFAMKYGFNYFLDFVPKGIRKFSYAASFGIGTWEYDAEQTKRIQELLQEYSGVSVREDEAVALCKDNIGLTVEQMPDPTLLLDKEDYQRIASPRIIDGPYVFIYWIGDKSFIKREIENFKGNGYNIVFVGLREKCVLPSVQDWLSYVQYADIVLTDSFHGAVFALIFERPLKIFPNDSGGNGRIDSLMELLGLNVDKLDCLTAEEYKKIEERRIALKEHAKAFINESIK